MSSDAMPQCDFHAKELILKLNMSIDADVSNITPVVEEVMEIVKEMKCAAGKEFEVEMALREALANAVIHGAKHDKNKQVQFCVACDPSTGLLIVVRDPGEGFDPASIPDCCTGQNVFSDHGRGIFLINQLMDEVRFERGGTEIHMRKY
jgi:serine/threonine-protein kinase RsbW